MTTRERPLFEDATANSIRNSPAAVDTHTAVRGPLLQSVTLAVAKLYAHNTHSVTDCHEYEGKGHSLTIDAGWQAVATDVLAWPEIPGFAAKP